MQRAGRRKSVVEIVERGTSRVFLRPCRGFAESSIPPTVPPYSVDPKAETSS